MAILSVVSPDGKNEIRLHENPLRYEVLRGGKTLVAPSPIGMQVEGQRLKVEQRKDDSFVQPPTSHLQPYKTPLYKKSQIDLAAREVYADFGDWGIRLVARNDGVAYRFEMKRKGEVRVDAEQADLIVPDPAPIVYVNCNAQDYKGDPFQNSWESLNQTLAFRDIPSAANRIAYLPLVLKYADGTALCVTESDLYDYPGWNFRHAAGSSVLTGAFAGAPAKLDDEDQPRRRQRRVEARHGYLVKTSGTRHFPWRAFILAEDCTKLCESDLVAALATKPKDDFGWVKPGFVAWDWWNAFDNQGNEGCNTQTYERFIDFAAQHHIRYVILDEGWSEKLNIWKYHPNVDVPHIIRYATGKGVDIILWMAWAQADGMEEQVAEHFAKLGAKGFKVDFMDRDDADCVRFLERFAAACARRRLIVDYHGMFKPTGMEITWPNVVNFEGVHGLENMKWYGNNYDFMSSDVKSFFVRLTAGPMDYTPGAMDNYPVRQLRNDCKNPGSCGTRCRQLAMMSLYFAPLQMLCDSPTKYEKNPECLKFMAEVPLVWDETRGLNGGPDEMAACVRRKGDVWYAAGMTNEQPRDYVLDTAFLGTGIWQAEIFRDAADADVNPTHYVRETRSVTSGEKIPVHMAPGGGFTVRFTRP